MASSSPEPSVSPEKISALSQEFPAELEELPSLTPAVVQRVREGLAAARDRSVRASVQQAIAEMAAIAEGGWQRPISGGVRRGVLRSLLRTLFDIRIEQIERLPQEPALLAANHLNHIDPFLLLAELPAQPYHYVLADARTLYNKAWKRQVLGQAGGVIPIERLWREELAVIAAAKRDRPDLAELAADLEREVPSGSSVRVLRQIDRSVQAIFAQGDGLIVFPEGRLGTSEGELRLPLKRGTVTYALRAGVPIVPIALIGTRDLYWRKRLIIRFGNPLQFPRSPRPKPAEVQAVLEELQRSLTQLLPDDYHEPAGLKLFRGFLNHMFW